MISFLSLPQASAKYFAVVKARLAGLERKASGRLTFPAINLAMNGASRLPLLFRGRSASLKLISSQLDLA